MLNSLVVGYLEDISHGSPCQVQPARSRANSRGYDSHVALVMRLLSEAVLNQPRVLGAPAPAVALSSFGTDGLEFTVGYWLADPENGSLNLKSLINLDILSLLRENQNEIPFPQRVVQMLAEPPVRTAGSTG